MTAQDAKDIATENEYKSLLSRIKERAEYGYRQTFILDDPCQQNLDKLKAAGFQIKKGPFFLGGLVISWDL